MRPSSLARALALRVSRLRALGAVLAVTAALPVACGVETESNFRPGALGAGGSSGAAGAPAGESSGDPASPDGYDPARPTNSGPGHNAAGFASVAPLLARACSECHHAGSWLDLGASADAATAAKIVGVAKAGTMPPSPRAKLAAEEVERLEAWLAGSTPAPASAPAALAGPAVTQVLSASSLATYKAALPKVGWPRLDAILKSASTLFWDKAAIPPAYQDTVGDGAGIPFGARLNSAGKSLIVPEGKKLFSEDGTSWSFPFGHTAGADETTNAFIVDFMSLPESNGALRPVVYRVETATTQGLPIKRWNWSFPKGAVLGEIILIRDGSALLTAEIRVRERFADTWATNVFRPFPTASLLANALKVARPSWETTGPLKAVVDALGDTSKLASKQLTSPAFANMVTLDGSVDAALGDLGDDALVRQLLATTTFVSAYGTAWKKTAAARAFGPTGPAAGLSVVPTRFDTGLLEVRESTCTKCHDQGGTFIGTIVDQAILYGDVWGTDRIFSFHPFEPSRIDASGNENRSVRAAFASIVVPFDAALHGADYTFYRP